MTALAGVIAFMFAALVTRLWFLQILATEEYQGRAETNRIRLVPVLAPRGQILDRSGEGLVTNEQSIVITLDRSEVPAREENALLEELSGLLKVPVGELRDRLEDPDYLPYQPVPIAERVPLGAALYIGEHREQFPGVDYEVMGARTYVHGALAPHLLGTLGEITQDELADPSFGEHLAGQLVGRGGVEQYYEHFLRGENGWKKIEVDASGEVLSTIGRQEPVPGNDLFLSLDWRIQQLAQDTLAGAIGAARSNVEAADGSFVDATAGAVVVLEPNTGHVLAMASFPTYDPRKFLHGITERELAELYRPERNYPLNNRAIAGLYPPGSTFKPFVAAAAVRAGYANPNGFYSCTPDFIAPGDESGTVFHNWTDAYIGPISLRESLVRSCDTVYYRFGWSFYADRDVRGEYMQAHLERWGFGSETGVDIPGEQEGRIPDQRWKQQVHQELPDAFPVGLWYPGDDINMSIGQGDVLVTPLQMAVAYGAIANGGTLYRPQIGLKVVAPDGEVIRRFRPQPIGRVPSSPQTLAFLRDALTGVVSESAGTATAAFAGFPHPTYPVAGKTGTSEVSVHGREATHSWFAAIAPANDPEYVVVAMVEEGGHGSQVAAPIVRVILEHLLGIDSAGLNIAPEQAVD
jgi:penicillin-binding protein 2